MEYCLTSTGPWSNSGLRALSLIISSTPKISAETFPVCVHGLLAGSVGNYEIPAHDHAGWKEHIKGDKPCQADTKHLFEGTDLAAGGEDTSTFNHVELTLVPDGGVKRLSLVNGIDCSNPDTAT